MNCDDVFAILTRGPFPTGSRLDGAVEKHLLHCFDCGRLAEALRPNDDSVQEAVGLEESRVLPGYRGEALSLPGDLIVSLDERGFVRRARRQPSRPAKRSFRSESLRIWQFAAAVTLGMVLDGAFRTLLSVHAKEPLAGLVQEYGAGDFAQDRDRSASGPAADKNQHELYIPTPLSEVNSGGESPAPIFDLPNLDASAPQDSPPALDEALSKADKIANPAKLETAARPKP